MNLPDLADQVNELAPVGLLKRDLRARRRAERRSRWAVRRRQIRCFWTWPLGHAYQYTRDEWDKHRWGVCVGCSRQVPR